MKTEIEDMRREIDVNLLMLSSFWENEEDPELKKKHMRFIDVQLDKLNRWSKTFEDYE